MVGAVIYVRVSTKEQTEKPQSADEVEDLRGILPAPGLPRARAIPRGGREREDRLSHELQNLLQFCRKNKGTAQFVVVFNLTWFAREKYDHLALGAHLKSLGISLRPAMEPIDDTSTGELMARRAGCLRALCRSPEVTRRKRAAGT
jgi:DNA invertase Pin-like site-specific DNA recombinase